ncbi:MAG TPA: histidine kinase [Candidatus Dormibacteraeota bacterium]|jgi:signal transduction histidine kinase|nr:histidine kinase [Candidatus Dormibacteraeota bacterium]
MRRSPEEAAVSALEDLRALHLATRRLCGLLDSSVLVARAAQEAHALAGTDFTSVAVTEKPDLLAMRGTCQATSKPIRTLKVPAGKGLGGRVLLERRPIVVADYGSDESISHHFNPVVAAEGLHGLAGVPIDDGQDIVGVLYTGIRRVGVIGDRAQSNLLEFARSVGPMITAARHAEQQTRLRVSAERQRIGRELHDSLGPLLFGIGISARKARERAGDVPDLVADLDDIQSQASSASSQLREALRQLAPIASECAFSSVLQMQVQPFTQRSGIPVSLVVLGSPRTLTATVQGVLLSSVREGLHNIERHAGAASVVITVKYDPERVTLVVQDDGRGLPARFELGVAPDHDRGWGLPAILGRAQSLGGDISLFNNDDGGATLRVCIPTGRGDDDPH